MTDLVKEVVRDFRGGMNTYSTDELIQPNEVSELKNMRVNEKFGGLDVQAGSLFFKAILGSAHVAGNTVDSIYRFYRSDGTAINIYSSETSGLGHRLVADDGATLQYMNPELLNAITEYFVHNDQLFYLVGTGALYKYNGLFGGSAQVVVSGLPFSYKMIHGEIYNTRAYYAGDPSIPNTIVASQPDTPDVFDNPFTEHIYHVAGDDGDGITALKQFGGQLIAFRRRSIYILDGSPPRRIYQFPSNNIGCIDKRTIQRTSIGLVFLSNLGVYLFNGTTLRPISTNIRSDLQYVIRSTTGRFSSALHNDTYYLFYQDQGKTDIAEGFAIDLKEIEFGGDQIPVSKISGLKLRDSIVYSGVNEKQEWIGVYDNSNVLVKAGIEGVRTFYDEAGDTSISPKITTRWIDMGDRTRPKHLYYVVLGVLKPINTVNLKLYLDYRNTVTELDISKTFVNNGALYGKAKFDQDKFDSAYGFYTYMVSLGDSARADRVKIEISTDSNSDLTLDRLEIQFMPMKDVQW